MTKVAPESERPLREGARCYWCGASNPSERDHVFARGLFAEPRPPNLITVPACRDHNRLFSLDEEYFRDFVLAGSYAHPEGRKLWDSRTRRSLQRKPSYRAMLAAQMRRIEIASAGGIVLGRLDAIVADAPRINRVLTKITRGLYWEVFKEPLGPVSLRIDQVRPDQPLPEIAMTLVRGLPAATRIGHAFYRMAQAEDHPGAVLGVVGFFDRVVFLMIGTPSGVDDRGALPRGRRRSRGGLWLPP